MIAQRQGHSLDANWLLPALLLLAGVALAWSQLDAVQREQWLMRTGGRTPVSILRLVGGVLLVLVGVLLLVWQDAPPASLLRSAAATLAVLILSLIHISEPTRLGMISYAVFCLKKKKQR